MKINEVTSSNSMQIVWFVFVCIVGVCFIFWPQKTCREVHEKYSLNREFAGIVTDKYKLKYNHSSRELSLSDGQSFTAEDGLKEFWEAVEIGDSLVKKAGSLEFTLYKDDTVLTFIPDCL